jgi:5'-deoxynucleotidase YfbR-like HD superfamily hydrolase
MNEKLMEIFTRDIIASLPKAKRRIYQFIENEEDRLAQICETKEQFLNLLKDHSPHQHAANRFNMAIGDLYNLMHEIENEINMKLDSKIQGQKWIDCTEKMSSIQNDTDKNLLYFLFLS